MLKCKTVTRLLSEAQERGLTTMERMRLAMHLAMCPGCRNYKTQIGFLRTAARSHPAGNPKADGDDSV
jgi:predicted anti-sigma-YlaC factor YlaD